MTSAFLNILFASSNHLSHQRAWFFSAFVINSLLGGGVDYGALSKHKFLNEGVMPAMASRSLIISDKAPSVRADASQRSAMSQDQR